MATSTQNNPPMDSHSCDRFPWKDGELVLCLRSVSSFSTDARPRMLVKLTLSHRVLCLIPSPLQGKYYKLWTTLPPTVGRDIPVDDPSAHFSTLDAAEKVIAPFVPKGRPPFDEISTLLWPRISRFAHATARSAEAMGHGDMEVVAEASDIQKVKLDEMCELVDRVVANRLGNQMEEEEPWETCAVCLDEIKERARAVTLECSHDFHLRCIAAWLEKKNSCPLCRSKQPTFSDDE